MKNKHRKAGSAVGTLDGYAIRAEEYASYLAEDGDVILFLTNTK